MSDVKRFIKKIPLLGNWATRAYRAAGLGHGPGQFEDSRSYWESRYASGGDSGVGSYSKLAEFKAEVLNSFVAEHAVQSVIEFGCGDGNQLKLAKYPSYIGFDVSETAVARCRNLFADDRSKAFALMTEYAQEKAELALSLDVVYHLVEDNVFEAYMKTLFESSNRYLIIYSSDKDAPQRLEGLHVRHRKFSAWVEHSVGGWRMVRRIPNRYPGNGESETSSFADFYIYEKCG